MHSGFASSRSCQNPSAQTPHTPFCNSCQSLFLTAHWHLDPHPQQDLSPRAKRKGFSRQSNRSNRNRTNPTKNLSLHRTFCQQQPSVYKRKHLAWISLERNDQPGVCVVCCAELLRRLAFHQDLLSEHSWFMASLTLHCSITAVGDSDKAAAEPDHCRQEESQGRWRMKSSHAQRWDRTQGAGRHLTTLKKASVLLLAACSLIPDLVQTHINNANLNIHGIMPHTEFLKVSSTFWPWTSDAAQTSQWPKGSYQGKSTLNQMKICNYQIYRGRLKPWKILLLTASVTPKQLVLLISLSYFKYSKFRYLHKLFTQLVVRLIDMLYAPLSDDSSYKYQRAFCHTKFDMHQWSHEFESGSSQHPS